MTPRNWPQRTQRAQRKLCSVGSVPSVANIDRPGPGLDTLLDPLVSCRRMSRGIVLLLLAGGAFGCSSAAPAAPAHQMAPTAKVEGPVERQSPPVAAPVPTNASGETAARINNEIITWKDVQDVLKEIKPGDVKTYGSEEEYERVIRIRFGTKPASREDKRRQILIYKLYRHLLQQSWTNPGKDTPGLMLDFVAPEEIREYYTKHPEQFQAIERISFMRIGRQFSGQGQQVEKMQLAESVLRKLDEGAEFAMMA